MTVASNSLLVRASNCQQHLMIQFWMNLLRWNAVILWNDLFLLRRRMLQYIKQAIRMGKEIFLPSGKSETFSHWKRNRGYTQKDYLWRLYGWNIKWNDESIFFTTLYHLYQFTICNLLSYCSGIYSCTTFQTTKIKFYT